MRALATACAAAILVAAALRPHAMNTSDDEHAIQQVLAAFVAAVNRQDLEAFGHLVANDAEFVVIAGQYLRGRDQIQTYHAGIWQGADFAESQLTWHPMHVRFLRPEVAVAHVAAVRTDKDGAALRHMVLTVVVAKQDTQWVITALQNTVKSWPAEVAHGSIRSLLPGLSTGRTRTPPRSGAAAGRGVALAL